MDTQTATSIVANDVRESYPDMSDDQAIEFVRNTVTLAELVDDDELDDAYRTILKG